MADSLRDQLLKSGLVQKLKAEAHANRPPERAKPAPKNAQNRAGRTPESIKPERRRTPEEMDLARAYGLRDRAEREQREQEKKQAEARAREKAERKQKLAALLDGQALNKPDADVARHFPHGDKIRRVYCTSEQLTELNAGQLAVVQYRGRYLLVPRTLGEQAGTISPEALVLLCDPDAPTEDDIPADLVW
jgi:uncharacterized protein YaiL (DUF2058 family)